MNIKWFSCVLIVGFSMLTACAQNSNKIDKNNFSVQKSEEEWKKELTPEQYYVLREKGTEAPFSGEFVFKKDSGNYVCRACGNVLFSSDSKFESHCGWPSFDKEIAKGTIIEREDHSHGMERTEILCAKCGSHLGHVFNDGPTKTGIRYCVNSASLGFEPEESKSPADQTSQFKTVVLGGGCFWCMEAVFEELNGVQKVESGYSGGAVASPSYETVSEGNTNHAEVIRITYDPKITSFEEILKVFFTVHDPTQVDGQGADIGTQYRSTIFYQTPQEQKTATEIIQALDKSGAYDRKIVTEVVPFKAFYPAEQYHQDYYANNKNKPYCRAVIQPKIEKFEKVFKDKIKK